VNEELKIKFKLNFRKIKKANASCLIAFVNEYWNPLHDSN
jgi:hypothetical protein